LLYDSLIALGLQDRARHYLSRFEAAGTAGLLVSFPLGSYVASLPDYPEMLPVPFLLTVASSLLAGLAYFWMIEPARSMPAEGFVKMGVRGLSTIFANAQLRAYVLNAVTISSVTFFAFWFYQPVAGRAGMPVAYLGLLGAGFNLFSALLLANLAFIERAVGIPLLLQVTAVLPALLFASLALVGGLPFVVVAFFALVGCRMLRIPVLNDLMNRHVESENRATVISSVSLVERFITFLLYPLVGALADLSLDYALIFLGVACGAFAVSTRLSRPGPIRVSETGV
jgi:hypothetical protein